MAICHIKLVVVGELLRYHSVPNYSALCAYNNCEDRKSPSQAFQRWFRIENRSILGLDVAIFFLLSHKNGCNSVKNGPISKWKPPLESWQYLLSAYHN